MSRSLLGAVALLVSSLFSSAFAQTWIVERVQGPAFVVANGKRTPLEVGARVAEGTQILTARGARVKLGGPGGAMMVGPETFLELRAGTGGLETTAVQRSGMVEFDLDRRKQPYFSVETPAMAAVVKGTRFIVVVAGRRSDVGVRQGVVEVLDFRSGQVATLLAGERAATRRTGAGLLVGGPGTPPAVRPGHPRAALAKPFAVRDQAVVGSVWTVGEDGWAAAVPGLSAQPSDGHRKAARSAAAAQDSDNADGAEVKAMATAGNAGGDGNAAGNGKGNAGGNGNGNGNAGGNGNGNAGGNGNGNAGGNGNGNGKGQGR
jgi:hypothetical protein